jgi:hypothetical protein
MGGHKCGEEFADWSEMRDAETDCVTARAVPITIIGGQPLTFSRPAITLMCLLPEIIKDSLIRTICVSFAISCYLYI